MKSLLIILCTALILYAPKAYKAIKANTRQKISLDKQLSEFENLGIKLNKGVSKNELLKLHTTDEYESTPWELLYIAFGHEAEGKLKYISNNCWHFDAESIEGDGSYADIIRNLGRISNGEMNFTNIKDNVDVDNEKAWVSFEINGDKYKYELKVDADWADGQLFDKIQGLAKKYNTRGKFTMYQMGQDGIIGYIATENLSALKATTKLDIQWLEGKHISE